MKGEMKSKPEGFTKCSCCSRRTVIPVQSTLVSVEVSVSALYAASTTDHLWNVDAVIGFVLAQWFLEEFLGELDLY